MKSPAQDIAEYLVSADSSASTWAIGTDIFCFHEPNGPDYCLTVLDSGGMDPDVHGNYVCMVQLRSRGRKGEYREAYENLIQARNILHASYGWIANGTYYEGVWQQGDIMPLGLDDKDRPILTVNFRLIRRAN